MKFSRLIIFSVFISTAANIQLYSQFRCQTILDSLQVLSEQNALVVACEYGDKVLNEVLKDQSNLENNACKKCVSELALIWFTRYTQDQQSKFIKNAYDLAIVGNNNLSPYNTENYQNVSDNFWIIASRYFIEGQYNKSAEIYKEGKSLREKYSRDQLLIPFYEQIGLAYSLSNNLDSALHYFKKLIAFDKELNGDFTLVTFKTYINISLLIGTGLSYEEALSSANKALSWSKSKYQEYSDPVAIAYYKLGNIQCYKNEDKPNALDSFQKSLTIFKSLKSDSITFSDLLFQIGNTNYFLGQIDSSRKYIIKYIRLLENINSKDNFQYARALALYGTILRDKRQYNLAEEYYQKALKLYSLIDETKVSIGFMYNDLGYLFFVSENYKKSIEYCRKYIANVREIYGLESPQIANAYEGIARTFSASELPDSSILYLNKSYSILKNIDSNDKNEIIGILNSLIFHYIKTEVLSEAEKYLNEINKIKFNSNDIDKGYLKLIYSNYALFYDAKHDIINSIKYRKLALEISTLQSKYDEVIDGLLSLSNDYTVSGEIEEAKNICNEAISIYFRMGLTNDSKLVSCYEAKASLYSKINDIDSTLFYYNKALELTKKQGPNLKKCILLSNYSTFCSSIGFYKESQEALQQELKDAITLYGQNNPFLVDIYNNLGFIYYNSNNPNKDFKESERYLFKALQIGIQEKDIDGQIDSYINLANAYNVEGDDQKSNQMLDLMLGLMSKLDINVYTSGYTLQRGSLVLSMQKQYLKSLTLLNQAEHFYKKFSSINSKDLGSVFLNKGIIYFEFKDFKKSKENTITALNYFRKDSITCLTDLARTYSMLAKIELQKSNYKEAQEYLEISEKLNEAIFKYDLLGQATEYFESGLFYSLNSEIGLAEKFFKKALNLLNDQNSEPSSLLRIQILNILAKNYISQYKVNEAFLTLNDELQYLKRLESTNETTIKNLYVNYYIARSKAYENSDLASSIASLDSIANLKIEPSRIDLYSYCEFLEHQVDLLFSFGKYSECLENCKKIISTYSTLKINTNSHSYADTYQLMGKCYFELGQYDKSKKYLENASNNYDQIFGKNHINAADIALKLSTVAFELNQFSEAINYITKALNIYVKYFENEFVFLTELERLQYIDNQRNNFEIGLSIFFKCSKKVKIDNEQILSLTNFRIKSKGLVSRTNINLGEIISNSVDTALNYKYLSLLDLKRKLNSIIEDNSIRIDNGVNKVDQYLRDINLLENEIKNNLAFKFDTLISVTEIQKILGSGDIGIEVIRFREYSSKVYSADSLFTYSGLSDTISYSYILIPGGANTELKFLYRPNQNKLDKLYYDEYLKSIRFKVSDTLSYQRYWYPLALYLKNFNRFFVSNDGIYHKINLNTLSPEKDQYLLNQKFIHYLTSISSVSQLNNKIINPSSAVLIGNPSFYISPLRTNKVNDTDLRSAIDNIQIGRSLSGTYLSELPGTLVEVNNIQKILEEKNISTIKLINNNAKEDTLKTIINPDILHIATHGYYSGEIIPLNYYQNSTFNAQFSKYLNPLFSTGLFLAGSQNTINGKALPLRENGILTSYEASNLKLNSTKLVVLSACKTGLGEIMLGEGVFGLQNGFFKAGVDNLIMSLWDVDDNSTQHLMSLFYKKSLEHNNYEEALREAQIEMLKEGPYSKPFDWGSFVLIKH